PGRMSHGARSIHGCHCGRASWPIRPVFRPARLATCSPRASFTARHPASRVMPIRASDEPAPMSAMVTLQDVERAHAFYRQGYWRSDTMYGLLKKSAERTPDRFALRDSNGRLTFRAAVEWVDGLAQDLHDAGVRPGDRVSIWLPSRIESALVLIAC